jgi:K+-transporting ATPase KdpF subunit
LPVRVGLVADGFPRTADAAVFLLRFYVSFLCFVYTALASLYNKFRSLPILFVPSNHPNESRHGYRFYRSGNPRYPVDRGNDRRLRKAGRAQMNAFYVIGALSSAGLLVYLLVALLNAERF